jgi:hypothetical protein
MVLGPDEQVRSHHPGLMQESADKIRSNALVDMVLWYKDPGRVCDASLKVKWKQKQLQLEDFELFVIGETQRSDHFHSSG